ncbi:hypothetical protein LTR48_009315, partial [Friedmanniomyces endolithicus]
TLWFWETYRLSTPMLLPGTYQPRPSQRAFARYMPIDTSPKVESPTSSTSLPLPTTYPAATGSYWDFVPPDYGRRVLGEAPQQEDWFPMDPTHRKYRPGPAQDA